MSFYTLQTGPSMKIGYKSVRAPDPAAYPGGQSPDRDPRRHLRCRPRSRGRALHMPEARLAGDVFGAAERDPLTRHLRARLRTAGSRTAESLLYALGAIAGGDPPELSRVGEQQDSSPLPRRCSRVTDRDSTWGRPTETVHQPGTLWARHALTSSKPEQLRGS